LGEYRKGRVGAMEYQVDRWQRKDWRKGTRHYSCGAIRLV
jgi:hypothetical protein